MMKSIIAAYVKANARTFTVDRVNTVGASEVGQCARKVFFVKNADDPIHGATADDGYIESWGATLRGRLFEDHVWAPAMRTRFGDKLIYAGTEQRTFVSGFLSATPDALVTDLPRDALALLGIIDIGLDGCVVFECKTIDPRAKLDAPKFEHAYQAQVQMGLLRELTPYRPLYAVISYANASFLDEITEFVIKFDPVVFENAKTRATRIVTARSPDELKPEGWIAGSKECEYCAFTHACGRLRRDVPTRPPLEELDPRFVAAVANLAREIKQRENALEVDEIELRTRQHDLREQLRRKSARQVVGNGVSITWSAVGGRPTLDISALREAATEVGLDLAKYESTGDPTDRLTIRITEQSRAAV